MFRGYAQGGIIAPEEFKKKYMGIWNIPAVPDTMRPCTVDGQPALFHRFVDNDSGVLHIKSFCRPEHLKNMLDNFNERNFIGPDCEIEKIRKTMALIEWPDGRLCTVALERVQFTDREVGNNG